MRLDVHRNGVAALTASRPQRMRIAHPRIELGRCRRSMHRTPAQTLRRGAAMTETLYLPNHVHCCVTEGHLMFLDLKTDEYNGIRLSDGVAEAPPDRPLLMQRVWEERADLLAAGVLTTDPTDARVIEPLDFARPDAHILGLHDQRVFGLTGEAAEGVRVTLRDVFDFCLACWRADRDLKPKDTIRPVERVRRRKSKRTRGAPDLAEIRRLTAVFGRLRPWYPRDYLCLYDSLALVEFLARRGHYPDWVFAVHVQPWGAHCWVQAERKLLNEGTEFAGQFTPIMAV